MQFAPSGQPVRTPVYPPASFVPRRADGADLDALVFFERRCFEPRRRDTRRTIAQGLRPGREVWLVEEAGGIVAALFLRPEGESLRLYSLAADPAWRGQGLGELLVRTAIRRGRSERFRRLSLEVDAAAAPLISWYERFGFERAERIPDFYGKGGDAWRLCLELVPAESESEGE